MYFSTIRCSVRVIIGVALVRHMHFHWVALNGYVVL